jgi:hypothetical protein
MMRVSGSRTPQRLFDGPQELIEIVDVAAGDAALMVGAAGEVSSTPFALDPTAEV